MKLKLNYSIYRKLGTVKQLRVPLRKTIYIRNDLIEAQKNFSTMEMRILILSLSCVNPHFSTKDKFYDTEFKEIFFPTSHLVKIFCDNTGYLEYIKKACHSLANCEITLSDKNGGLKLTKIFKKIEYIKNNGLHIIFDDSMRPYLLDLVNTPLGFTRLSVDQLLSLNSVYSMRLLELLVHYRNIPVFKMRQEVVRKFTVEELKFYLGITDQYKDRINNFKYCVIDAAIKEINQKTLYKLRCVTLKLGLKTIGYEIHMDMTKLSDELVTVTVPAYYEDALLALLRVGFRKGSAVNILKRCGGPTDCMNRLKVAKGLLEWYKRKHPVKNELGFLRKAIVEKWGYGNSNFYNKTRYAKGLTTTEIVARETVRKNPVPESSLTNPLVIQNKIKQFKEAQKKQQEAQKSKALFPNGEPTFPEIFQAIKEGKLDKDDPVYAGDFLLFIKKSAEDKFYRNKTDNVDIEKLRAKNPEAAERLEAKHRLVDKYIKEMLEPQNTEAETKPASENSAEKSEPVATNPQKISADSVQDSQKQQEASSVFEQSKIKSQLKHLSTAIDEYYENYTPVEEKPTTDENLSPTDYATVLAIMKEPDGDILADKFLKSIGWSFDKFRKKYDETEQTVPKKEISPFQCTIIFDTLKKRGGKKMAEGILKSIGWTLKEFLEVYPAPPMGTESLTENKSTPETKKNNKNKKTSKNSNASETKNSATADEFVASMNEKILKEIDLEKVQQADEEMIAPTENSVAPAISGNPAENSVTPEIINFPYENANIPEEVFNANYEDEGVPEETFSNPTENSVAPAISGNPAENASVPEEVSNANYEDEGVPEETFSNPTENSVAPAISGNPAKNASVPATDGNPAENSVAPATGGNPAENASVPATGTAPKKIKPSGFKQKLDDDPKIQQGIKLALEFIQKELELVKGKLNDSFPEENNASSESRINAIREKIAQEMDDEPLRVQLKRKKQELAELKAKLLSNQLEQEYPSEEPPEQEYYSEEPPEQEYYPEEPPEQEYYPEEPKKQNNSQNELDSFSKLDAEMLLKALLTPDDGPIPRDIQRRIDEAFAGKSSELKKAVEDDMIIVLELINNYVSSYQDLNNTWAFPSDPDIPPDIKKLIERIYNNVPPSNQLWFISILLKKIGWTYQDYLDKYHRVPQNP